MFFGFNYNSKALLKITIFITSFTVLSTLYKFTLKLFAHMDFNESFDFFWWFSWNLMNKTRDDNSSFPFYVSANKASANINFFL
jgi:hypothetical protein